MTIQNWSDDITVAEMADDPQFADEMAALAEMLSAKGANVVLNVQAVTFLNSSNISSLLRLRKQMLSTGRRLIISGANDQVGGVFVVTGLDKIFEFTSDVATALAKMQLGEGQQAEK
jgi:anti-anti-sigma factor